MWHYKMWSKASDHSPTLAIRQIVRKFKDFKPSTGQIDQAKASFPESEEQMTAAIDKGLQKIGQLPDKYDIPKPKIDSKPGPDSILVGIDEETGQKEYVDPTGAENALAQDLLFDGQSILQMLYTLEKTNLPDTVK